ncbi:hypothetical protein F4780DRAFT_724358 [Xylariomycetidae sp. FL0641]|nr:hypothetical protein F4780DRAFT_724358 [Xylariomycetidae sp. FL0641]
MSPVRRRSARIASSSKRHKASPAPQLISVVERDESPDELRLSTDTDAGMASPKSNPRTPGATCPVKLPLSEMHPSKARPTTAAPSTAPAPDYTKSLVATGVDTPSKIRAPSSDFTFRFVRDNNNNKDMTLGPEAQKIMDDLRGDAARIKAELKAKHAQELAEQGAAGDGRPIAKATSKTSRFSAAHMAEFKKMDSIANHPSAFRAGTGRTTPLKGGIKRSKSKAELDEPESARSKTEPARAPLKRVEERPDQTDSPLKRFRQRLEDDASTRRPISRDGTSIPRPKSSGNDSIRTGIPRSQTHNSLMTPTKSSLARANLAKTPTGGLLKSPSKQLGGLVKSPSKPELGSLSKSTSRGTMPSLFGTPGKRGFGGLKKSATTTNLDAPATAPTHVQTPGRFDRVKSILKKQLSSAKPKSNIPRFADLPSQTPGKQRAGNMDPPPVPFTTPGKKVVRHVDFTPETKRAAETQNSPSPIKSGLPRSKSISKSVSKPRAPAFTFGQSIDTKLSEGTVAYPDLSAYGAGSEEGDKEEQPTHLPESIPGTFSFRSDHTIRFNSTSPIGFGGAAGQASVRHVRESMTSPIRMPGTFSPALEQSLARVDKENSDPNVIPSFPHGISNKKRHRATWEDEDPNVGAGIPHGMSNKKRARALWEDEDPNEGAGIPHGMSNKKRARATEDDETEEAEGTKRATKKLRKQPPTDGEALFNPRLTSPVKRPAGGSLTPSPQKKRTGISMSRLQMLARPKVRK